MWYSQTPQTPPRPPPKKNLGVNIPFYWRPRTITRNKLQKLVPGTRLSVTEVSDPIDRGFVVRRPAWELDWADQFDDRDHDADADADDFMAVNQRDRRIWISKEYFSIISRANIIKNFTTFPIKISACDSTGQGIFFFF